MIYRRMAWLLPALLMPAAAAGAHERFIKHTLLVPLHNEYFRQQPGRFLGIEPNMLQIATMTAALLVFAAMVYFFRQRLDVFIEHRLLGGLGGRAKRAVHHIATFLMDKPVHLRGFHKIGEWAVIFMLRSPALVLMYSASAESMVMPSFPLNPSSATALKFAQVALAVLIITQSWLPLVGALVLGVYVYLAVNWGWLVALDALPVLGVAAVYITSPRRSHKLVLTGISAAQHRWLRILLGIAFLALGWAKIYNHDLTAGVADNYPSVMEDPLIGFFAVGTDAFFRRENWVVAFAMAEVMSGFMLMVGLFTRFWGMMMLWVFTKLLLVDFGWQEVAHVYPIASLLVVVFSNHVANEFGAIERFEARAWMAGWQFRRYAGVFAAAVVIAALAIYPMVYLLTFTTRAGL